MARMDDDDAAQHACSPLWRCCSAVAAVLVVVQSIHELDGDSKSDTASESSSRQDDDRRDRPRSRRPVRASYTVKLGDTLGLISEKTGVPVERLQELNPDLDPQELVVGQKIKLRE